MPNPLPAIKVTADQTHMHVRLEDWDALLARLTVAEARLGEHHRAIYNTTCAICARIEVL